MSETESTLKQDSRAFNEAVIEAVKGSISILMLEGKNNSPYDSTEQGELIDKCISALDTDEFIEDIESEYSVRKLFYRFHKMFPTIDDVDEHPDLWYESNASISLYEATVGYDTLNIELLLFFLRRIIQRVNTNIDNVIMTSTDEDENENEKDYPLEPECVVDMLQYIITILKEEECFLEEDEEEIIGLSTF